MKRLICSALAFAAISSFASAVILFQDTFDTNTSGNYTISADPDTLATFVFNYASMGIPAAPNSTGGSTIGLKLEANNGDATAASAALSLAPNGGNFSGNFTVRFDVWLNSNGPFPGGGTGSTQFFTAGVGTNGATVHKASGNADGTWFGADGDGGSGIDYRVFLGPTLQAEASGYYVAGTAAGARSSDDPYYSNAFPGQAPPEFQQTNYPQQIGNVKNGALGFQWRQVEIAKTGTDVTWSIDGLLIAMVQNATFAGDNVFVGYWDPFISISDNPALTFGVIDNLRIEAVPEPATSALGVIGALGIFARRRRNLG
jgi:hypothetical protein